MECSQESVGVPMHTGVVEVFIGVNGPMHTGVSEV